jgi:hypothetical protein
MAEQKKQIRKGRTPSPRAGEPYFLATMDRASIKKLKLVAIKDGTSASASLEEAAKQWLERWEPKAKKASEK